MNLTRHHIDIANEMRSDFGLSVDLDDPLSVIHALKYDEAVRRNEKSGRELLWERAKELLIGGVHPYSVEDQFPFFAIWGDFLALDKGSTLEIRMEKAVDVVARWVCARTRGGDFPSIAGGVCGERRLT